MSRCGEIDISSARFTPCIYAKDPRIHLRWHRFTSFVESVRICFADAACWDSFRGDRNRCNDLNGPVDREHDDSVARSVHRIRQ